MRGRRIDSDRPPVEHAQYVVFWDGEVPRARQEIEALLAENRRWGHPEFDGAVRQTILAALVSADTSKRCLFGRYT